MENLLTGGDNIVNVHSWHVTEQEDALIELSLHQLTAQLVQDCQTNAQGEGGVAQQQTVPEVEYFVQRKDMTEHGEEPGNGVEVRNET